MSSERSVKDLSGPYISKLVEPMGFEPTTSSMPSRRAPNCATAPPGNNNFLDSTTRMRLRLEYELYGETHFSWRGRMRYGFQIFGRGSGQTAAGGLRHLSGVARAAGPKLQAAAGRSENGRLRHAHARALGSHRLAASAGQRWLPRD